MSFNVGNRAHASVGCARHQSHQNTYWATGPLLYVSSTHDEFLTTHVGRNGMRRGGGPRRATYVTIMGPDLGLRRRRRRRDERVARRSRGEEVERKECETLLFMRDVRFHRFRGRAGRSEQEGLMRPGRRSGRRPSRASPACASSATTKHPTIVDKLPT